MNLNNIRDYFSLYRYFSMYLSREWDTVLLFRNSARFPWERGQKLKRIVSCNSLTRNPI